VFISPYNNKKTIQHSLYTVKLHASTSALFAAREAYVMMTLCKLKHVLYTECSFDNRPAKILRSYCKSINYYGRHKFGLQLDVTQTSNCSQRFKSHDEEVTSNHGEGLKSLLLNQIQKCKFCSFMEVTHITM
jgi:hypothetical protein